MVTFLLSTATRTMIVYKCNFTKETEQEIIALYEGGAKQQQIADQFGCSRDTIYRILNRNGISRRDTSKAHAVYTCNEDYFAVIDTEEKAYWLGFLAADGFVNTSKGRWGVTLALRDKQHLEKLREHLEGTHPVNEFAVNKAKGYYSARLHVCNEKMKNDLVAKGIVEKKTDKMTFPTEEQVPKHLIRHYMRGYFDGDGSIYFDAGHKRWRLQLLGTEEFLQGWLNEVGLPTQTIHDEKRSKCVKYINIASIDSLNRVLRFLYDDCSVSLDRKYERYKLAIESH